MYEIQISQIIVFPTVNYKMNCSFSFPKTENLTEFIKCSGGL